MNRRPEPALKSSATVWIHPHPPVIHMKTAVELLGQEIAKRVAARVGALTAEIAALRKRQQTLRSDDPAGVHAVFDEFGRGRA